MEKNKKTVEIQETEIKEVEAKVENQHPPVKEETKTPEVKHTIFGSIDQKILAVRDKRALKKANKKPKTKGEKAAIIGGSVAVSVGVLGLAGKALLNAASKYADDDSDGDDAQELGYLEDGYGSTEPAVEAEESTNNEE